jgi:hypothetical protein
MTQIERLLAQCLEDLEQGDSVEECLARYPEREEELEPLLRAAQCVRFAPNVIPAASFRQGARARMLDKIQARTPVKEPDRASRREGLLDRLRLNLALPVAVRRLALPALATITIVLLLGMMSLGVVYAASESLPGDSLYAVKLAGERVRLALSFSEINDAKLHLRSASERLEETATLVERDGTDDVQPLMQEYAAQVQAASRILHRQRARGMDVTSLSRHLHRQLTQHEAVLSRLREEVSEEARSAVEQALAASREAQIRALEPKEVPASSTTSTPTSKLTVTTVATEAPTAASAATVRPTPTETARPTETQEPTDTTEPDQESEPARTSVSPGYSETPEAPGQTRTPHQPDGTKTPQPPRQTNTPQSSEPTRTPLPPEQVNTPKPPGQTNTPQSQGETKMPQPSGQTRMPSRPGQTKTP